MLTDARPAVPRTAHRHDVDGLRAVAVLVILAFHLGLAGFPGGFVGVDIFFVISGFVITRGLLVEIERGNFSVKQFYVRRARRLMPALVVTLLLSLVAGSLILSPAELREFSESALASLFSLANFFFYERTNYFANAGHYRPLLHTWSLSVEEQFYLVFPLLLAWLAVRRRIAPAYVIAGLVVLSFAYCAVSGRYSENHAFYLPMARFWEIGVGALVAAMEAAGFASRFAGSLSAVGAAGIILSVALMDGHGTDTWMLVLPVASTAAMIVSGMSASGPVFRALCAAPAVVIGRMSYSIYLVHWPLIVFWRMCIARPFGIIDQLLVFAFTLALAALLWRFVERPLRADGGWAQAPVLRTIAAGFAAVIGLGIAARYEATAQWRMAGPARDAIVSLAQANTSRPRCVQDLAWLPGEPRENAACRWGAESPAARADFVIWGDSHARALAPELAAQLIGSGMKSGVTVGLANCPPIHGIDVRGRRIKKGCANHNDSVLAAIIERRPELVVLVGRWANVASDLRAPGDGEPSGRLVDARTGKEMMLADALIRTMEIMRSFDVRVIVVGPVPELEFDVPATLNRALRGFSHVAPVPLANFDKRQRMVLAALTQVESSGLGPVLYPHKVLCDGRVCNVEEAGLPLYSDDDHLSPFGASRVVRAFAPALASYGLKETQKGDAGGRP